MNGIPSRATRRASAQTQVLNIGCISSAVVTVAIWAAKQFWNVDVPATLAPPLTTIAITIGIGVVHVGRWLYLLVQKS